MAPPDALDAAARALARRDRSRRALVERLQARGFDEAASREAVSRLEELGAVDDDRYARNRAAALAERGYGDSAIEARLTGEGIDRETAAAALAELEPESERALRDLRRLGRRDRARQRATLVRRGFGPDAIEWALARLDDPASGELR